MNNENEIEKMARISATLNICDFKCSNCANIQCEVKARSKRLADAGIGDKEQAVEEFVKKFWDEVCNELNDVLDENPHMRIRVKRHINNTLNRVFNEFYGG